MTLAATTLETARLRIRPLDDGDAAFILELLNEPDFLHFIGDRGVRTIADSLGYIQRARASHAAFGLGLNAVELKATGSAIGIAGLMQKPWLDHPDLAYALRQDAAGHGYATEAAIAVLADGLRRIRPSRVLAVVTPDNAASIHVLEKLGFQPEGHVRAPDTDAPLQLYQFDADSNVPSTSST